MASAGPYANHLHLAPASQPHQHLLITQFFTGRMLFLMPNQQCQSTEGKSETKALMLTHIITKYAKGWMKMRDISWVLAASSKHYCHCTIPGALVLHSRVGMIYISWIHIRYFLIFCWKYQIFSVENIRFFVLFSIYVKMQQIIAVLSTKSDLITICTTSVISLKISVVLIWAGFISSCAYTYVTHTHTHTYIHKMSVCMHECIWSMHIVLFCTLL